MQLTITMNLDNAAMRDEEEDMPSCDAVADTLNGLSDQFRDAIPRDGIIRDANGNTIGRWAVTAS